MSLIVPANVFSDFANLAITSSAPPPGITYNAATRTYSGTPTTAGTTPMTLTATDIHGVTNTTTFNFIVITNTAPVFNPSPIPDVMFNINGVIAFNIPVTDA